MMMCAPAALVAQNLTNLTVCTGSSFTIASIQDADDGATYQWTIDGEDIPGATDAAYTDADGIEEVGAYLFMRKAYTETCGWQASNGFMVQTMSTESLIPQLATPETGCAGNEFVFTASVGAQVEYRWTSDDGGVAEGNSYTFSDAVAGTKSVEVVAVVGGGVCTTPPATASVVVLAHPVITVQPEASATVCTGATAQLTVAADNITGYQWRKNGADVTDGTGGTSAAYTTDVVSSNATYTVVVTDAAGCSTTSNASRVTPTGTAPGSTVTFAAFNPCSAAATYTTWTLRDTRTGGNSREYKVRKMEDGHIWMVQDLRFGTCPNGTGSWQNETTYTSISVSPTIYSSYIGHCRASTQSNAGYLYTWVAATQGVAAYYGGAESKGCTGMPPAVSSFCQGICPSGWHLPTGDSGGEYRALNSVMKSCSGAACWNASSNWEGALGGYSYSNGSLYNAGEIGRYWSSTAYGSGNYNVAFTLAFEDSSVSTTSTTNRNNGYAVRCIKNY